MTSKKRILAALCLLPLFVFAALEEGGHSSATMDFVGKVVNFLILFGGLAYVLYKPVRDFLNARASTVAGSIRDAETSRAEAREKSRETEGRLARLEEEIAGMKSQAEADGLREKNKIAAAAAEEAQKIRRLAGLEMEAQTKAGIKELKTYAAEAAAALVRERIRKKLTAADQSSLIDKSIERLSKLDERPRIG
jgi:F-type H+-transporting ATPase subunit b